MAHAALRAHRAPGRVRRDRGAVAVEFALIMPILVLLVFGIISYGYMLSFRQGMSQAAAEGARAAAVAPSATTSASRIAAARDAINDALSAYGVACTSSGALTHTGGPSGTCTIEVKTSCTTGEGACAEVSISYPYRDNPLIPSLYTGVVLPSDLDYTTEVRIS